MGTETKAIDTASAWLRNQERLGTRQERRPQIYTAADLLGPGFSPTATQILDWNSDEASFNGFFWSPVGSINSPDSTIEWAGISVAQDDRERGVQKVWSVRDGDPVREYTRRFSSPLLDGTRVYTTWRGDTDWQSSGIVNTTNSTLTSQSWKITGGRIVTVSVIWVLTVTLSVGANGNISGDPPIALVPPEITPAAGAPTQGLQSTSYAGAYRINSDGLIRLNALSAGVTAAAGTSYQFAGSYVL